MSEIRVVVADDHELADTGFRLILDAEADIVVVGDSVARRKLAQFVSALPLLTTPIVLALQRIP